MDVSTANIAETGVNTALEQTLKKIFEGQKNDKKTWRYTLQESELSTLINALDSQGWVLKPVHLEKEWQGWQVSLIDNDSGRPLASAVISKAEHSTFAQMTHVKPEQLEKSVYLRGIWIDPRHKSDETIVAAIAYLAMRRGRIWGRRNIVAWVEKEDEWWSRWQQKVLGLKPLKNLASIQYQNWTLIPCASWLEQAMYQVYWHCNGSTLEVINHNLINEVLETYREWLTFFFRGAWARSIYTGKISKEQYIYSLYNLHQYVRQTTRLCARCIAHSENVDLRNHYIYHLKGEINHEVLIEKDLEHLGVDVSYLKKHHVPHPATKEFMMVQESTIAYYQDPVLMLACPFVAEGMTAAIEPHFIEKLHEAISGWKIKQASQATRFLASHVKFDGGEDGHWRHVIDMIKQFVNDEWQLQRFLSVLVAAMNSFEKGFNASIEDLEIWSAMPSWDKVWED